MDGMTEQQLSRERCFYEFMNKTDRSSLYRKLNALVKFGMNCEREELNERRNRMREFHESQESNYEKEWSDRMLRRRKENIERRLQAVHDHQAKKEANRQIFLAETNIRRNIENCPEIRDKMNEKFTHETKICQEEQILENQRLAYKECEQNKRWATLNDNYWKEFDKCQEQENMLKNQIQKFTERVWELQCEDKAIDEAKHHQQKMKDFVEMRQLAEELRIEEFDAKLGKKIPEKEIQLARELLEKDREVKERMRQEKCDLDNYMIAIRQSDERRQMEDKFNENLNKRKNYLEALKYLRYVKNMRDLNEYRDKFCNDIMDEAIRVDDCSRHTFREKKARAEKALKEHLAVIQQQRLDAIKRFYDEEKERREDKMLINWFAKSDPTPQEIREKGLKHQSELKKQIAETNELRKRQLEEEAAVVKDPFDYENCKELAKIYLEESIDHLQPHENWYILQCKDKNKWVEKARKHPFVCTEKELQPCGCQGRSMVSKCGEMKIYEMLR